jgi:sugar/nucleoside kinase (ribokinase family)
VHPLGLVGSLSIDLIDGGPPQPGGPPFHAARALRFLSRRAVVVTRCGSAERPQLLPALAALGLPVVCLDGTSTSTFAFRYEGDVRHFEVVSAGDPWTVVEARSLRRGALAGVQWLHVGPVLTTDFPAETLAELAAGRRLSYDGHGLVRRSEPGPLRLETEFDRRALEHVSILKLAEEEAVAAAGSLEVEALAALGPPEVLVTFGSEGALVVANGKAERVHAHPVLDVDPTGSGDAFAAGYLAARSSGVAPLAAARQATSLVATLLAKRRGRR